AAHIAINPRQDFEMTLEALENWVEKNCRKWPEATDWLQTAWSVPVDHWAGEQARKKQNWNRDLLATRQKRRESLLKHLSSIYDGTAPAGLVGQVALAYQGRYSDIRGDTPIERVQEFLAGTRDEAVAAVAGLEEALKRPDLPNFDEILKIDIEGRSHYIRPACLLAATLAFQRDPNVIAIWADELVKDLVAFRLTEGVGNEPDWFLALASQRASVIAPVLERFGIQRLKKGTDTQIPGLWYLAQEDRFAELARLVIPTLLRRFPARAKERHLRILNGELLPAAARHLTTMEVGAILAERLALKSLDIPQRIAYLVAGLPNEGEKFSRELVRLVGTSESMAAHLGRAFEWQGTRNVGMSLLPTAVLANLIEMIAPFAPPRRPSGVYSVGDAAQRREWVDHFIKQLAADASSDATTELKRLANSAKLSNWKSAIDDAVFDQSRAKREMSFHQPSMEDVANVLSSRSPANAQDLAALFLDHLSIVEQELRGDNTNGMRLFRREDRVTSKSENECRDILKFRMADRLKSLGIGLEKEGQAAEDTRSDLRAEYIKKGRRIVVPIEVKKENHRELWSAWRTQLSAYMLDPDAEGVGIYLALWFGQSPKPTPEGKKLRTAQELREALISLVPEDLRCRLHVAVLDLSMTKPQ
ncbi:MAG: hypothetical protein ACKVQK_01875, partial [Burkholderiales bacterium]